MGDSKGLHMLQVQIISKPGLISTHTTCSLPSDANAIPTPDNNNFSARPFTKFMRRMPRLSPMLGYDRNSVLEPRRKTWLKRLRGARYSHNQLQALGPCSDGRGQNWGNLMDGESATRGWGSGLKWFGVLIVPLFYV
jgi:hypothetical protein